MFLFSVKYTIKMILTKLLRLKKEKKYCRQIKKESNCNSFFGNQKLASIRISSDEK